MSQKMSRDRNNINNKLKVKCWKEIKYTRYLLTQFGATSPTSGGYQARKESTIVVLIQKQPLVHT